MEKDEYDDELPPISVNSSKQDESVFAMPSAEVLASQRARADECERALQRLNEQHERQEYNQHLQQQPSQATNTVPIATSRSNSSGSEGETALASAVEALRVRSAVPAPQLESPSSLLERLLRQLPPGAAAPCRAYREALHATGADVLTDDMITSIRSWLSGLGSESAGSHLDGEMRDDGRNLLTDDEAVGVGAWLCAVVVRDEPSARARRALHALLRAAAPAQALRLARAVLPALRGARALLRLAQALARAGPLARAVERAALERLLRPRPAPERPAPEPLTTLEICELVTRGWGRVAADERDAALRLVGRALAAASERAGERASADGRASAGRERAALERALATLARPPSRLADERRPDRLEIAVAASKLKVLLSDRN